MPYPQNYETALSVQNIISASGCTPATVAVINGDIKVGLSDAELKDFATKQAIKIGKRDLGFARAKVCISGIFVVYLRQETVWRYDSVGYHVYCSTVWD